MTQLDRPADPSHASKLWALLTRAERRSAIGLLGSMLVGMILETLGIGLVIPALALLTQQDLSSRHPILVRLLAALGNPSHAKLVIVGMLALFGIFVVKALFLSFLAWQQIRFVFELQADLSRRLLVGYMRQPYSFHLERNSAQLIRNAIIEVSALTNVTQPGLVVLTEALVLVGITTLLVIAEPVGAVIVATTIGLAGWAFYRATRTRILRWGTARQLHEGLRIQHLQQALGGVKEVKLFGREDEFVGKYHVHNLGSARVSQRQYILQALPRLWLELLAVGGLGALVVSIIEQGKPIEALLPTVGLFAVAAFRVLPSVNRVINSIQAVRYSLPVIDTLYSEIQSALASPAGGAATRMAFGSELTVDDVGFRYPSAPSPALTGVSLTIKRGSSVGFVGTTGAGKSTLIDVILGLLPPGTGAIRVDGVDIRTNVRGWQDQIGYVPQSIFLIDDSFRRNVAFGLPDGDINDAQVWSALRAAQLDAFVTTLPDGLDTVIGERGVRLSGGQRQRIGIARALYHDPPLLVLDEASSSLDVGTERDMMEAVSALRGNKTILIVTHRFSTIEHCDRVFRLENGTLVENRDGRVVQPGAAGSAV